MLDPVGGWSRIKDFFTTYLETAFRIADVGTAAARRDLLARRDSREYARVGHVAKAVAAPSPNRTHA